MLMAAAQFLFPALQARVAVSMPTCLGGHAGERVHVLAQCVLALFLITDERTFVMAMLAILCLCFLKDLKVSVLVSAIFL